MKIPAMHLVKEKPENTLPSITEKMITPNDRKKRSGRL
jgi:hypothetical protein